MGRTVLPRPTVGDQSRGYYSQSQLLTLCTIALVITKSNCSRNPNTVAHRSERTSVVDLKCLEVPAFDQQIDTSWIYQLVCSLDFSMTSILCWFSLVKRSSRCLSGCDQFPTWLTWLPQFRKYSVVVRLKLRPQLLRLHTGAWEFKWQIRPSILNCAIGRWSSLEGRVTERRCLCRKSLGKLWFAGSEVPFFTRRVSQNSVVASWPSGL